jgi:hypothetical protein
VYDRHCQNALYIFQAKKTSSGDQWITVLLTSFKTEETEDNNTCSMTC